MALALRIVVLATLAWFIYRVVVGSGLVSARGSSAGFQCGNCRHCGVTFDDGVMCHFAGKEAFKNEVHISNCHSFEKRA